MLDLIKLILVCGTVTVIAFAYLLALPNSRLRDFMAIAWGIAREWKARNS